jgi:hypothetical protein
MATDVYYDVPEFTKPQRLQLALKTWEKANGTLKLRELARKYDICHGSG